MKKLFVVLTSCLTLILFFTATSSAQEIIRCGYIDIDESTGCVFFDNGNYQLLYLLESSFGYSDGEKVEITGTVTDSAECGGIYYPLFQAFSDNIKFCPCCKGITGNANYDPQDEVDISDLVYIIESLFPESAVAPLKEYPSFTCFGEVDVNADGGFDITDVVDFVDYMFNNEDNPILAQCRDIDIPVSATYSLIVYDSAANIIDQGTLNFIYDYNTQTISGTYELTSSWWWVYNSGVLDAQLIGENRFWLNLHPWGIDGYNLELTFSYVDGGRLDGHWYEEGNAEYTEGFWFDYGRFSALQVQ